MQTTAGPPIPLRGINFYRSPVRVAVLMFFADVAYLWWWLWQFFQFTKREGFPRARSFWWPLVQMRCGCTWPKPRASAFANCKLKTEN